MARASALVLRCQKLEQENEELAASADVAKGVRLFVGCVFGAVQGVLIARV